MDIQETIAVAKKNGCRVFQAKVSGIDTIYRSITRKEFRDLQKKLADKTESIKKTNPDNWEGPVSLLKEEGEEHLVLKGVLQPKLDSELDLTALPAGFVPVIAEKVMEASGFGQEVEVKEL